MRSEMTLLIMLCVVGWFVGSLMSLCHSNGHIETMPAREINPFTALTRIRSQFLRTQRSKSNHYRVDTTTPQTAKPSGLAMLCIVKRLVWAGDMICERERLVDSDKEPRELL